MTMLHWTLLLAAALVGVLLSAVFSGMETGLYTINRVRLELRRREGRPAARIVSRLVEHPARMLAVVLVGTNAANYLGSWSIAAMLDGSGVGTGAAIAINTIVLVPILLILGEILPKDLFRAHADRWCYALARPLRIAEILMTVIGVVPLVEAFGRWLSHLAGGGEHGEVTARQRMADMLKEGVEAGVLSQGQTDLLDRALRLRECAVEQEMIPWSEVCALTVDATAQDRAAAIASRWTRFPVTQQGRVLGVASVLDLHVHAGKSIEQIATEALRLRPDHRADVAVRWLAGHVSALAIVEDDDGLPLGIVTLKDLVEPLTGELADL